MPQIDVPDQSDQDWDKLQEEIEESHKCEECSGRGHYFMRKNCTLTRIHCDVCNGTGRSD